MQESECSELVEREEFQEYQNRPKVALPVVPDLQELVVPDWPGQILA